MPATAFFPIWPLFPPKMIKIGFFPHLCMPKLMTPQKKLQTSNGTHDPLFDNNKIWPTLIFLKFVLFGKSPKLSVHALNHDSQKKKLQAPTRAHDLLFWPKKIWPTLIFPRFTPPNTFPKLPVHVLINDPPPKKLQASTRTHAPFFDNTKIWPTFIFPRFRAPNTFPKLPVHALINDPYKKVTRINCDPWPTFWQQQNLTFFNIFEVCAF